MARILGLDTTKASVRGALVRTGFRTAELERYVEVPIPGAAEGGGSMALAAAIEDLKAALGKPPDAIVAALDGEEASLRRISVPAAAQKKLAQVLPFELEALLPFELEDSVMDYQVLRKEAGMLEVLTAAVPRERVAHRLDELNTVDADPMELAVGAASLDGLPIFVSELQDEGPFIVVTLDEERCDLAFFESGSCVMARTLSSGFSLVRAQRHGELEGGLKRTLAGYRASGGAQPMAVYLCGAAATLPEAASWLAEVLGVESRFLSMPEAPGASAEARPRFAKALALAARATRRDKRIDLRRGEFAPTRTIGGIREHARLIAICSAFVVASFLFSIIARRQVLAMEQEALRDQLAQATEAVFDREVRSVSQARQLLHRGRTIDDPMPKFDAFAALDALSRLIDPEIDHLTQRLLLEIDDESRDGTIEVRGQVDSISERDAIASALEEHRCFTEIERGATSPGPGNEGTRYRLEATIRCPEDQIDREADEEGQEER